MHLHINYCSLGAALRSPGLTVLELPGFRCAAPRLQNDTGKTDAYITIYN